MDKPNLDNENNDLIVKNSSISNNDIILLNTKDVGKQGEKIINTNHFLRELSELMEDEKFNRFFNKYMKDWIGIKSTVTYMRLYKEFKDKYEDINDEELDKNIVVFLLTRIMRNNDLRPASIKTIDDILEDDNLDFFNELERNIKNKNIILKLKN